MASDTPANLPEVSGVVTLDVLHREIDLLRQAICDLLQERDRRMEEHFSAIEKAVEKAEQATQKAIDKAEAGTERRFEAMGERITSGLKSVDDKIATVNGRVAEIAAVTG